MQSAIIFQQLVQYIQLTRGFNGSPVAANVTAVAHDDTSRSACAEECQELGKTILKESTHSRHIIISIR